MHHAPQIKLHTTSVSQGLSRNCPVKVTYWLWWSVGLRPCTHFIMTLTLNTHNTVWESWLLTLTVVYLGSNTGIYHIIFQYSSLVKERPWAEHLTSLPKRVVGTLVSVSAFNHERAPMYAYYCLEKVDVQTNRVWELLSLLVTPKNLVCMPHVSTSVYTTGSFSSLLLYSW